MSHLDSRTGISFSVEFPQADGSRFPTFPAIGMVLDCDSGSDSGSDSQL
jgi:hypothetical protein